MLLTRLLCCLAWLPPHRAVYLKLALKGRGTKVGILRKPKPLHLMPGYSPAPAPLPVDLQLD
eukprot:12930061-Prorocentrum_lima.AAC.1